MTCLGQADLDKLFKVILFLELGFKEETGGTFQRSFILLDLQLGSAKVSLLQF